VTRPSLLNDILTDFEHQKSSNFTQCSEATPTLVPVENPAGLRFAETDDGSREEFCARKPNRKKLPRWRNKYQRRDLRVETDTSI